MIGIKFCWIHLKTIKKLEIKRTTLKDPATGHRFHFKGVFAVGHPNDIVFKPNDEIVRYSGEKVSRTELSRRYGKYTVPYRIEDTTGLGPSLGFLDAALKRSVGAMINFKQTNNAALGKGKRWIKRRSISSHGRRTQRAEKITYMCVKALKNIRGGDEIFADYGKAYKMNEPTSHKTENVTKKRKRSNRRWEG